VNAHRSDANHALTAARPKEENAVKTVVIVLVVAACGGSRVRRGWSGRA
jgi:hypothetical protein